MNIDKTEFLCCNQDGSTCSLNGKPLKLVDQIIYLGSSISTSESHGNICIGKVWVAIDRKSTIWNLISQIKSNGNSSKLWPFQDNCMAALLEHLQNAERKTLMETTRGCCVLF